MNIPFKVIEKIVDVDIVDNIPYLKAESVEVLDIKLFVDDKEDAEWRMWWNVHDKITKVYKNEFYNKELDLKPGSTIYFDKGCKVSREKLKSLLEKTKCRVIRDHSKADIIITCLDSFDGSFAESKSYMYNVHSPRSIPFNHDPRFKGFSTTPDVLIRLDNLIGTRYNNLIIKKNSYSSGSWYDSSATRNVLKSDIMSSMVMMYHESKGNVYDESSILKLMGETVIDKSGYEGLCSMMESNDRSNHNVVMTILANCNYERSAVYIMMLLFKYGGKMWDNPIRSSVAFKGLISYIGKQGHKLRYSYADVITVCSNKGIHTQDMIDVLYTQGLEEINYDDDVLTIVSYDFNPEVKTKLYSRLENDDRLSSGGEVLQQEVQLQL